jgi:hypothetical protein
VLIEGRNPEERKRFDAVLNAPLERQSARMDGARRMAAFAAVGRAEVVR